MVSWKIYSRWNSWRVKITMERLNKEDTRVIWNSEKEKYQAWMKMENTSRRWTPARLILILLIIILFLLILGRPSAIAFDLPVRHFGAYMLGVLACFSVIPVRISILFAIILVPAPVSAAFPVLASVSAAASVTAWFLRWPENFWSKLTNHAL